MLQKRKQCSWEWERGVTKIACGGSHPPPKNVSRTSKKKAAELFDENLYSLPENPLPESECSSRISISSSSKNKSGWLLSTKAWGGVICIMILLTAGIMTAIYLPFALRENQGKFENIKLQFYFEEFCNNLAILVQRLYFTFQELLPAQVLQSMLKRESRLQFAMNPTKH